MLGKRLVYAYSGVTARGGGNDTIKIMAASDFHEFAPHSAAPLAWEKMDREAPGHQVAVWKGDMHEFINHWNPMPEISELTDRAIARWEGWGHRHPHLTNYILPGNHERFKSYLETFKNRVELTRPENLAFIDKRYLRIGDALFMHGDLHVHPERYDTEDPYAKPFAERVRSRHPVIGRAEIGGNIVVPGMLEHAPPLARIKKLDEESVVRKIHDTLARKDPEALKGLKYVFFGHTHLPINRSYRDVTFINTGAAIARNPNRLRPLTIELDVEGHRVQRITPLGEDRDLLKETREVPELLRAR